MVNARQDFFTRCAVLLLAAVVLTGAAWNRGAEYDEQYTLFVTSGTPRPIWPDTVFPAGNVARVQAGHAGLAGIARDLRHTDVHPPLYFWTVAAWRWLAGDGLFVLRLLSVGFSLGALAAVGSIARRCGIPPALAMLLTLGCYGFAYTGEIARGFALAQMLTLLGIANVLSGQRLLAGALLGAAVMTNYLAIFVCALPFPLVIVGMEPGKGRTAVRRCIALLAGFLPPVTVAAWFFLTQRGSRTGQFPPFELLPSLGRLARYGAANLTGGLPLYVSDAARPIVTGALAFGLLGLAAYSVRRWKPIATPPGRLLLVAAALSPPIGLLLLGLMFDNTPIELRYLSFATPFVALLVAGARPSRIVLAAILIVQAASIAGLILRPETMQPARATAYAAAALTEGGVILVPSGNDGIGIIGAFASELPPTMPLLAIGPDETTEGIKRRVAPFRRVVLALLAQDAASQTAIPTMRAAFMNPDWREVGIGLNVIAYQRSDGGD